MRPLRPLLIIAVLAVAAAGCAPSLSPLYRDYELPAAEHEEPVQARVTRALEKAGWTTAEASAPNVVATEEQTIGNWGLYQVRVSLEIVPVRDQYVRVYIHPYRRYVTGGRGKIPYLSRSLQKAILPDLNEAFSAEGLEVLRTPVQRDRMASAR